MKRLLAIAILLSCTAAVGQKLKYKEIPHVWKMIYGMEFGDTIYVQEIKFADGTVQTTAGGAGGPAYDDTAVKDTLDRHNDRLNELTLEIDNLPPPYSDSDISGSEAAFNGWDKNAADDVQINDATPSPNTAYSGDKVETLLNTKQDNLSSGTNIKTVKGISLLGSGNIPISEKGVLSMNYDTATSILTAYLVDGDSAKVLVPRGTGSGGVTYSEGPGIEINGLNEISVGPDVATDVELDSVSSSKRDIFRKTKTSQFFCVDGYVPLALDSNVHASEGIQLNVNDTLYHFYRFSQNGTHVDNFSKIMYRSSVDGGYSWSSPILVFDSAGVDDRNVSAAYHDGVFTVWFRLYNGSALNSGYITSDDLINWSDFQEYDSPTGIIVVPQNSFSRGDTTYQGLTQNGYAEWAYTTDGSTWNFLREVYNNQGNGYGEFRFEFKGDSDTCIGFIRTLSRQKQFHSIDGGVTWSDPINTDIGAPDVVINPTDITWDDRINKFVVIQLSRSSDDSTGNTASLVSRDSLTMYHSGNMEDVLAGKWVKIADIPLLFNNSVNYGYPSTVTIGNYYNTIITFRYLGSLGSNFSDGYFSENAMLYQFKTYLDSSKTNECPTTLPNTVKALNPETGIYYNFTNEPPSFVRNPETGEVTFSAPSFLTLQKSGAGNDTAIVLSPAYNGSTAGKKGVVTFSGRNYMDEYFDKTNGTNSTDWGNAYLRGDFRDYGLVKAVPITGNLGDITNTQFGITTGSATGKPTSDNYFVLTLANTDISTGRYQLSFNRSTGDIYGSNFNGSTWSSPIKFLTTANLSISGTTGAWTVTNSAGTGFTIPLVTSAASGLMLHTDKSKLDGIATGATANQTDAYLLDLTNHTGLLPWANVDHPATFPPAPHGHGINDVDNLQDSITRLTDSINSLHTRIAGFETYLDNLKDEVNQLRFLPKELTADRNMDSTDVFRRLYNETASGITLTITTDLDSQMGVGDQIVLQGRVSDIDIVAGTGVTLNGQTPSSETVVGPWASRVLEKTAANTYMISLN